MSVCVSGSDIDFTQRFDSGTAAEHRKSGHTRALKERIHIAFFSFLPFAFCLCAPEPTCWIRGATPRRILPMRVDRRMEGILVTHLRDYRLGLRHSSRAISFPESGFGRRGVEQGYLGIDGGLATNGSTSSRVCEDATDLPMRESSSHETTALDSRPQPTCMIPSILR
ncbi:uncharacterized protein CLUP02_15321 [Colletotrichum lupini]|uniref:Uncharacterized protein n=1 Tax=Colletotrichum lupini TaxID=145971 RepID=A0A9Q8T6B0_9PEZI|nr:uncharacterized protein CLUP02_15321 [Colletotrichum lupini]UQC89790.1 hypothetical protein CLUP02_15321 [Colletotrichum lupini]